MYKIFALFFVLIISTAALADEISVTVYNSNLGVVSEIRKLKFEKGINDISYRDVPSKIDANSVRFEVINSNQKIDILEQNYAFDLVSPDKMYQKYIDKEIEMFNEDGKQYRGTLLAYNKGEITILEKSGSIKNVMLSKINEVSFPSLPNGLITKPTLFWKYEAPASGEFDCNVSYQTGGMNWKAEYVAVLSDDETMLSLSGWAAIDNRSGKRYSDAKLKLIAGDINRNTYSKRIVRLDAVMAPMRVGQAGFDEKTFFEYHMYTLPRKTTLADNETKQISLFEPASSRVEKIFKFKPEENPTQVAVVLEFKNSKKFGLGMPLPAGRVRLFKADTDKSMVLLGEDMIKHTPKDEEMSLRVGYAFDIVGEAKVLDQKRISKQIEERTFQVEIRNRKSEKIIVEIERKLFGYWEIVETDREYEKKDANTIIFMVEIEADSTITVNYKVKYDFR